MLSDLLRNAVECIIAKLTSLGVGRDLPTFPHTVQWMEKTEKGRWQGRQEQHDAPDFSLLWRRCRDEFKDEPAVATLRQAIAAFAKGEGKFLPFRWEGMFDWQSDLLITEYFERAGSLHLNENVLCSMCKEWERDLRSDTVNVRAVYQVQAFEADRPFALASGIDFRPIDRTDIKAYGRDSIDPWGLVRKPSVQHVFSDAWICVIEKPVSKSTMDAINRLSDEIEDVVSALNLTIEGRALFSMQEKGIVSPFLSVGKTTGGAQQIASSRGGGPISLSVQGIERFQKIFARVLRIGTDDRLASLRLPLRRLRLSSGRMHAEDHLTDCVIALENLLANDSPQMETTFRFRLRGAALLPKEFGTIEKRMKLMDMLYNLRSKTVHGAKRGHGGGRTSATIDEIIRTSAEQAENVLRSILLWIVERSDNPEKLDRVLQELDAAMVDGGQTWAQLP